MPGLSAGSQTPGLVSNGLAKPAPGWIASVLQDASSSAGAQGTPQLVTDVQRGRQTDRDAFWTFLDCHNRVTHPCGRKWLQSRCRAGSLPKRSGASWQLSILGAITAASSPSRSRSRTALMTTRRASTCALLRGRAAVAPAWALAQPDRPFAPESPRTAGARRAARRYRRCAVPIPPLASSRTSSQAGPSTTRASPRTPVGGLCRFDWSKAEDRLKALAYRRALPFQVFNLPLSATPFNLLEQ